MKIERKQNSKYRRKPYAYILCPLPIYALIRLPYSFTNICPNSVLCQDHLTWYATSIAFSPLLCPIFPPSGPATPQSPFLRSCSQCNIDRYMPHTSIVHSSRRMDGWPGTRRGMMSGLNNRVQGHMRMRSARRVYLY